MHVHRFVSLFLIFMLVATGTLASPNRTTYQARIVKPDGTALQSNNVNFQFTILDPTGSCVLYVESYAAVNMANSGGLISFSLGNGTRSYPASATSISTIFDNSTVSYSCQAPGIFSPASTDTRKIVMQFNDGVGWQTLPAMTINAVPYAMYAGKADDSHLLNGKADTSFVEYSSIPTCVASQALHFNGATFSCVAGGGGGSSGTVTAGDITTALGFAPVSQSAVAASFTTVTSSITSANSAITGLATSYTALASSMIASINGSSSSTQTFALGVAGVAPTIQTSNGVHTFNFPNAASASVTAGLLSHADYLAFTANASNLSAVSASLTSFQNTTAASFAAISGSGISSFNGSTSATQSLGNALTGTTPAFVSANGVHTLNIPLASAGATTAGLISNADYSLFSTVINKIASSAASIAQVLGYTPADQATVTTLSSTVGAVSSSLTSLEASTAASFSALSASATQWINNGANIQFNAGNVSIGNTSGGRILHVNSSVSVEDNSVTANGPAFNFWKNRNYAATQADDDLGSVSFYGNNGSGTFRAASIGGKANGPTAASSVPGYLVFNTTASGSTDVAERVRIASTGKVGIGTSNPLTLLEIESNLGATNETATLTLSQYNSTQAATNSSIIFRRARGPSTAPTRLNLNDVIGGIYANGYYDNGSGTAGFTSGNPAAIRFATDEAWLTSGTVGTRIIFDTTVAGSSTRSTKMVLSSSGALAIGTPTALTKLDVSGGIKIGLESASCSAAYAGTLRYTAGNVEYCNGTTWTAFGASGSGMQGFNGSTSSTQSLAFSTTGTAPTVTTTNGVHTFNIPFASAGSVTAGLISNTDYINFNSKVSSQWNTSGTTINYLDGYVGIGTSSPVTALHIFSSQPASATHPDRAGLILEAEGSSVGGRIAAKVYSNTENPLFVGYRARGTKASPSSLLSGDLITAVSPVGYDGANWQTGAHIRFETTENWNANAIGSAIEFRTPLNGTSATLERMRIEHNGNVGIGVTNPLASLHVRAGTSSVAALRFTSGTLLTSATAGTMEFDGSNLYYTAGVTRRTIAYAGATSGTFDNITTINNSSGNIALVPNSSTGSVIVSATTASTNSNTGALVVKGGLGVAGTTNLAGPLYVSGVVQASSHLSAVSLGYIWGTGATYFNSTDAYAGGDRGFVADLGLNTAWDLLTLRNASGTQMKVDSGGYIGLGTASPDRRLTIIGDGTNYGDDVYIEAANSNLPGNFSQVNLVKSRGTTGIRTSVVTGDTLGAIAFRGYSASTTLLYGATIKSTVTGDYAVSPTADLRIQTISSGTIADRMTITGAGKVGIGMTDPKGALDVLDGSTRFYVHGNMDPAGFTPAAQWGSVSGNSGSAIGWNRSAGGRETNFVNITPGLTPGGFTWDTWNGTSYTNRMRITAAGKLGVGTPNPQAHLHVAADDPNTSMNSLNGSLVLQNKNTTSGAINALLFQNHDDYDSAGIGTVQNLSGNVGLDLVLQTKAPSAGVWNDYQLVLDPNGYIGIGHNAPAAPLDIINTGGEQLILRDSNNLITDINFASYIRSRDSAGTPVWYIGDGSSSASGTWLLNYQNAPIHLATSGTTRMYVDGGGNIGIGTTAPDRKLHIVRSTSSIRLDAFTAGTSFTPLLGAASDFGSSIEGSDNGQVIVGLRDNDGNDAFRIFSGGGNFMTDGVYDTPVFSALAIGNVGIGVSAPSQKLHVSGSIQLDGDIYGGKYGGTRGIWRFSTTDPNFGIFYTEASPDVISFSPQGGGVSNPTMVVYGSYVGIGVSAPVYQLQLSSDSAAKPGSANWTVPSDRRLKDYDGDFTRGLAAMEDIQPVYFNYKKDNALNLPSDPKFVGIFAQDIQKTIPEAIRTGKDGYLQVTNDSIFWTMFNAIKELYHKWSDDSAELHREIASVKAENAAKDQKIKDLEERLQKIESALQNQNK